MHPNIMEIINITKEVFVEKTCVSKAAISRVTVKANFCTSSFSVNRHLSIKVVLLNELILTC